MGEDSHGDPTGRLGNFIATLSQDQLNDRLIRQVERCFVDTVGVSLAGVDQPASKKAESVIRAGASDGEVTVFGSTRASVHDAVFVNGTAGHALDFDDLCWGMDGHPSVTLVAPILALGEHLGSSGEEAIAAFVAGFEAECFLAEPISPSHYERGWHATATFGTFGAAAACASLLDLSIDETQHALNIAASMPAGLKRNFGSMTKPLHVGHAGRSGTAAALLAAEGFTADEHAIDGHRGFLDLYSGEDKPTRDNPETLGKEWALLEEGVHVKKYPCCYFTHTSIAATTELVCDHELDPEEIESIQVIASQGAVDALGHDEPSNGLEAKFSMPYTVAHAAIHQSVDLSTFEEEQITQHSVRELMEKISLVVDEELEYDAHEATVLIEMGEDAYEKTIDDPPGAPTNPLTDEALLEKFRMCATQVMDEKTADECWTRLNSLREEISVGELSQML